MSTLSTIAGTILNSIGQGDSMRDYKHASRTFVDSLYRLAPKSSTLYHVFMDITPGLANGGVMNQTSQIETGLMAKSVALPKFNIATKTYNAYNRKIIQQEKINYDPVSFTFHDDSADVVLNFWKDYYSYYFRDSDYTIDTYNYDSKYQQRQQQNWGFSPRVANSGNRPYLNTIQIYSLHQKRFSSYVLVRPIITSFGHGQHEAGEYTPMEHQMTVAYEGVLYSSGPVSNGTVLGFDQIHYDNRTSPLVGPAGVVRNALDIVNGIQNGDLGSTVNNVFGILNQPAVNNPNMVPVPSTNLLSLGASILRGQNTQSTIFAPTSAGVVAGLSTSVSPIPGFNSSMTPNSINTQNSQIGDSNQGTPTS